MLANPRSHDDDSEDGGPRRPSRGFLERGKQAFSLLRRTGASASNAKGGRQLTRSPPPSRRWGAADDEVVPEVGARGRQLLRDGHGSPRRRDPMHWEDADWERRRSCSPAAKARKEDVGMMAGRGLSTGGADLGSVLLSGTL